MASSSMGNKGEDQLHIVMFPWLAFGHMIPWLEIAKRIAQKGHKISFISTPRNIDRLPILPPTLSSLIHFVKIPLPHVDNLPRDAEATIDVPYAKVQYLKVAFDLQQQPITATLASLNPDWIFYDFASYWVPPIATQLGIKTVYFNIFNAAALAIFGPPSLLMGDEEDDRKTLEDFTVPPKWITFPTNVAFRYFEIKSNFGSPSANASGVSDAYRGGSSAKFCDIVAIRSCFQFEPEWIQALETIFQKPVFPVGLVTYTADNAAEEETETWRWMKEWLDKQAEGSVVYIAFGSEAKLNQSQLTELAHGLELSQLPFFWVLRTRHGPEDDEVIELPEGFEERTRERGVVYMGWAPQLRILGHVSVGGFLTHAGWSSVLEGLRFGRPLILLAFVVDQGINASLLQEKQIGYRIPREERDGSFTRDSVAESLRLVMVEEEGKIYRDRAKEMRVLFGDRDRQDRYLDNLLGHLKMERIRKVNEASNQI